MLNLGAATNADQRRSNSRVQVTSTSGYAGFGNDAEKRALERVE